MNNWTFLHEGGVLYLKYNSTTIFILLLTTLNSHSNMSTYFSNILICDYLDTHTYTHYINVSFICM